MKMKMVLALVQTLVATSHEYGKCSWLYSEYGKCIRHYLRS
jgi:hypothetical protein